LIIESNGLKEHWVEFIMLSMKAKQDWVPYGNSLMMRSMDRDINYSIIEFKAPFISDYFGIYKTFVYQFTEESMRKLTFHLGQAHSKNQSEKEKTGEKKSFKSDNFFKNLQKKSRRELTESLIKER
jgi:hypothetical protein